MSSALHFAEYLPIKKNQVRPYQLPVDAMTHLGGKSIISGKGSAADIIGMQGLKLPSIMQRQGVLDYQQNQSGYGQLAAQS